MIFQQGQLHREQFFLDGEPVQVPARPGMLLPQFPVLLHQRGWRSGRWRPRFTGRSDGRQRPEQFIRDVLQPRYPPLQGLRPAANHVIIANVFSSIHRTTDLVEFHRRLLHPARDLAGFAAVGRSGVVSLPGFGRPEAGPIPPPESPAGPIRRRPIGERPALRRGRDPPQGRAFRSRSQASPRVENYNLGTAISAIM